MLLKRSLLFIILLTFFHGFGEEENYRNQATLLYYFAKYVEWPGVKNSNVFVISVYGNNEVTDEIGKLLRSRKVDDKSIIIKRCMSVDKIPENTRILYIPAFKSSYFFDVYKKLKNSNVVIVTEKKGYAQRGSHLNIVYYKSQMKFELNKKAFDKSKLKVSVFLEKQGLRI